MRIFRCICKPDELSSDELIEGMNFALQLCQGYRHLHTELKILFGEVYRYSRFRDNLNKLTEFVKNVKRKIRNLGKGKIWKKETQGGRV